MSEITALTTNRQLPKVDLEFGQEPHLLARVSDDPLHIGAIGAVISIGILCLPGANLFLLVWFWFLNASDIVWSLGEDPEEEYEKAVLDVKAQEVIEEGNAAQVAAFGQKLDCLGNPVVKTEQPAWPPPVEVQPMATGFTRAKDVIAQSSPEDLLNLMGDDAPDWLKLQVAQNTFEYPEPYPEERLDGPEPVAAHTPESFVAPAVRAVREPVSGDGSNLNRCNSEPVAKPVQGDLGVLEQSLKDAPYVIPVQGVKGRVYHIVRNAIALQKSQNWMTKELFGASKGSNQAYTDAVAYIKWVKEQ